AGVRAVAEAVVRAGGGGVRGALVVGIGARLDGGALPVAAGVLDTGARLAEARARGVAAEAVDAVVGRALGGRGARRAVGEIELASVVRELALVRGDALGVAVARADAPARARGRADVGRAARGVGLADPGAVAGRGGQRAVAAARRRARRPAR